MVSIVGLPKVGKYFVIMVIVDRLSKYAHFYFLKHPFTLGTVTQIFINQIFSLHGMPISIMFDRDPTLTNRFLKYLFIIQGIWLNMSTSYHPHINGKT